MFKWWMVPIDILVIYYILVLIHNAFGEWWKDRTKWEWWIFRKRKVTKRYRRVYYIQKCSIHGVPRIDTCPICNRPMQTIALRPFKRNRKQEEQRLDDSL